MTIYTTTGTQFSKAGIVVSYTDDTGAAATQNITFANKVFSLDSGLNVTAGKADFAGAAEIHGAAQIDSTLDVYGAGRFRNALVVDGAFTMGNSLNVAGAATMGSTLAVTGATNLNNTLAVAGAASMASTLAVAGASNLNNTLAVAGAASLNSSLAVTGAANLNSTLAVAGAASLNSSLAVIGATTLTGALDVKAASHLENTLLVDGATSLGAALTVTGATTLNNGMTVNGTSTHNGALVVSGAESVGGALGVTGAATMNSSLNVKGASHLEDVLVVDGAASLGSSLAVAGAASVTGAMDVTGASHLHNSVVVDGAASMGSTLAVSGAASMASTLDVTGASRLRNSVVVDGAASLGSSLAVTGAANLNNTLAVSGAANLNNTLAVSGAASLNNSLAVAGAASMASTLAVTGAANLNNTLAVSGAASLNNSLAVAGAASLGSSLAVTGASSMGSTLAVTGAATFQNNVTVNGNLTVLGSQTAIDTTSLQVKDNAILLADGNEADVLPTGIQLQYKPSGAAAVKYAGVKRLPTTGEFVFFKDSAKTIDDPTAGVSGTEFIVSPQKTGLNADTWTEKGITYTTTASSYIDGSGSYPAYAPFNNYFGQSVVYSWASEAQYDIASGSYTGGRSTTVLGGVGAVTGEWLQIQLSAPMAMDSYSFACGSIAHLPRQYYIVGSNDGSAWNPVQYGEMSSNPFTVGFTSGGSAIKVNQSGVQSIHGPEDPQTGSGNFTTYPTTGTKYSYYRIIAKAIYGASSGSGGLLELNEWYINFLSSTTATLPSSYTVEWKNLGGASFNYMTINQAVTTSLENVNYKFMKRSQGYNLPAGTYNYSATATNDDNYWDPFLLINEYGATVVTISPGVAPWSTTSPLTGTFTLAIPTMVYVKKTSNQYYAYNTRTTMTLTRTAPSSAPAVVADVYATVMADSFNSASDARLKKDVAPLEGALDKIDSIRGVHYHWVDAAQPQSRQVGVIAQEIQAVYPELVKEGGNGYLSVDYPKLTAVLIQSVKELKTLIMSLANK
jgi:acyl-[acyl carrier protein]--UDP-N-acetylglucosamine O-acyltransferase